MQDTECLLSAVLVLADRTGRYSHFITRNLRCFRAPESYKNRNYGSLGGATEEGTPECHAPAAYWAHCTTAVSL